MCYFVNGPPHLIVHPIDPIFLAEEESNSLIGVETHQFGDVVEVRSLVG
jgi:hypothetical protein